ncbi:exocyst complex component 3-like [Apostichopus japonicus]|uniref:exocyst complex component 3-like n=1 Tax=Stichopus japonicus TaxID=307972 RepID=UPI003AB46C16
MDAAAFGTAEIEAIENASKRVENMLKRPDQLERVEQLRRKEARKKASVEARLKTAMQSQLDGVKTGLIQLNGALNGIKEIRKWIVEVDEMYEECSELTSKLGDVKDVANEHSQLAAAVDNLKHIFTVPENIRLTEQYIEDEKYLLAHKGLMELESSRDDLFYELHKNPSNDVSDDLLLKKYFEKVETLSNNLFLKIKSLLQQLLNAVQTRPALIVTCLRIIEREERLDRKFSERKKMSDFDAPGRPKQWKHKVFEILEKSANSRIEGSQIEDRREERMWLVRHLELIRQNVFNDLKIVKFLCTPCFPPDYKIFSTYVGIYHKALQGHLEEMVESELEQNEIINLLTWLSEYTGPLCLGNPELGINLKNVKPLLSDQTVDKLQQDFMQTLHKNIQTWMKNALDSDFKDWHQEMEPESGSDGFYLTQLPVIIFQMIEQNLQVSKQMNEDLTSKVVLICVEELQTFVATYRETIQEYKQEHLADRNFPPYFFQYMVAIANNFHIFVDYCQQLERRHLKLPLGETSGTSLFRGLLDAYHNLAGECLRDLLNEMFMDLHPQFKDIMSRQWLEEQGCIQVDTICATIEDYYHDFIHLRKNNFESLIKELERKTLACYLKAVVVDGKLNFKTYEERKKAGEKLCKEGEQLQAMFEKVSPEKNKDNSQYESIPAMAEVIKLEDTMLISLEISTLLGQFPDMKMEYLTNILTIREDVQIGFAKELVAEAYAVLTPEKRKIKTIFSYIGR